MAVVLVAPWGASAFAAPGGVRIQRGVPYRVVAGATLRLDVFLPRVGQSRPLVVVVHGGGWRGGDRARFAPGEALVAPRAQVLARRGFVVASVDYRVGPAGRFPAAASDVAAAVQWLRRHARSLRVDPTRIALFGASAGGNLAALVAMQGRGRLDREARVAAVVSWSGPMDLTRFDAELGGPARRPFVEQYLGCAPTSCPARYAASSPFNLVDATDPPMLVVNASREIVPLEQATLMARRLSAFHVPHQLLVVPGTRHAAQYATAAWPATLRFLHHQLHAG